MLTLTRLAIEGTWGQGDGFQCSQLLCKRILCKNKRLRWNISACPMLLSEHLKRSVQNSLPVPSTSIAPSILPQVPRLSFTSSHSSSNPHTISGKNKSIRRHQTENSESQPLDIPVLKFVQMFLCSISQVSNSLKVSSQETLFSIKNHVRRKVPEERKLLPTIASYSKHHRQKGYTLTPLVSGDKSGWKAQGGTAG